jgi:hypothetical protein
MILLKILLHFLNNCYCKVQTCCVYFNRQKLLYSRKKTQHNCVATQYTLCTVNCVTVHSAQLSHLRNAKTHKWVVVVVGDFTVLITLCINIGVLEHNKQHLNCFLHRLCTM